MKVLVTGGTGFVGSRLVDALLARGDEVTIVTRSPEGKPTRPGLDYTDWKLDLDPYDGVVHLAGEPLFGKRWSPVQKAVIKASRVDSTRKIVAALAECKACPQPRAFVCASAIGIYGDRGDEPLPESASAGDDFLADVCIAWEEEAAKAREHGARVTSVRIGVVLGPEGGALKLMLPPFKLGVGGPVGSGKQYMSWIHVDDLVGLILHALDDSKVAGAVNGTAPEAVTNKEFTKTLGRTLNRPAFLPAPPLAMKLVLGEAAGILVASQRCVPERTRELGYTFSHPELAGALADLLGK